MSVSPAAEVDVTEPLVRSLLAAQHPDLAELPLRELGAGWDNVLWRLGDELLVRLPRRQMAAALTLNEQRWLSVLAPRLPLPIPAPIRIGVPSADYPWSWSVVPWLAGQPGDREPLTRPNDAAVVLGRFFRSLHLAAPADAPHNPFRGVPLTDRTSAFEESLTRVNGEIDVDATRAVWDWAVSARSWAGPPVWIHGDPHPANMLVADGTVVAMIDFGDVCAGDPATDLAGAWMLLPSDAMPGFTAAYGGIDPDLERRSLGWAVLLGLMLLRIGLDPESANGRPSYEPIGRATLARVTGRAGAG